VKDLPGCIKYILLFFLILLLLAEIYAGEFRRFPDWSRTVWAILLIKLLLIAILIWLIKVQKSLKCQITSPAAGECVAEGIDTVAGTHVITVKGTAGGAVFGHYTLSISGPHPYSVAYPPGGGSVPVTNGELGKINTTALDHGAYTITLTVFPSGAGSTKTCTVNFTLLKVAVYITRIAGLNATPNCFDEAAELVSGMHVVSVGGSLHLDGSAYVFECLDRKIERYELRYARVPGPAGPEPLQPALDAPVPATWPAGNQLHTPLVYDATKYWPWTEVGEIPTNLINDWGTLHLGAPSPGGTDYPILAPTSWNSMTATGFPGGGRYSVLLIVQDTATPTPHLYYDLQRVWIDNWPVVCKVLKFQKPDTRDGALPDTWVDLPACTDILMSWKKLRVIGLAWDALIDKDWGPTAPNDNFDKYRLWYAKEFVGGSVDILTSSTRVPNIVPILPGPLPTDADAGVLADWDLSSLDAGDSPAIPPTSPCDALLPPGAEHKLYRKCECTYTLNMQVDDRTVEEGASSIHHPQIPPVPIKIINDL
jgi:hypothetical protein